MISPGGRAVTLGTEGSRFHLFAFAYDGCRLYADTSHFLTDGNGKFPFLRSVLYEYLTSLHPGGAFDAEAAALPGNAGPEAGSDPYPEEPLPEAPIGKLTRPAEVFILPDMPRGYEQKSAWTSFVFRIRQKELMAYASGVDGSPATFVKPFFTCSAAV